MPDQGSRWGVAVPVGDDVMRVQRYAPPPVGLAVIGIDPGARWTAAVLRIGDYASHGWTLGPVNRLGELDPAALDDPDNWAAFGRYAGRDPSSLRLRRPRWTDQRLDAAEVVYTNALRDGDSSVRERIGEVVSWRLRHSGTYEINWLPSGEAFELRRAASLPDSVIDQVWPSGLTGLPIAITDDRDADLIVEKRDEKTDKIVSRLPVRLWTPDAERHLLVIGGTGAGKTEFVRRLVAVCLRIGLFPGGAFILDGKSSAGYACFMGREGVHMVAREPHEWLAGLVEVSGIMKARYDAQWNYRLGHGPKPDMPRLALILEECQEIRAQLGADADRFYSQLGRQCREAQITLILVTQRPDVKDAIPGAVRDMLEDRIVLGFVSQKGAQMALEEHWHDAVDNYGEQMPPGRGVARLAGKYSRIQGFYAGDPIDRPEAEELFPPKTGSPGSVHPTAPLPPGIRPAITGQLLLDPPVSETENELPEGERPRQRRRRTA